jgi:AcrR family transcriptional regulator
MLERNLLSTPFAIPTEYSAAMTDEPKAGDPLRTIWLRPARSGRGPVPEHSAEEIARAAMTLADGKGLAAVTMRAVAAAIGAAPASLYRYVDTRGELLELMADQAAGEFSLGEPDAGGPLAALIALGHHALSIYRRHRWLLDIPPTAGFPGPNGLAVMDHVLGILSRTNLSASAKLELFALFSGSVRSFAQLEADQQRAGRDTAAWQASVAAYLTEVVATGRYPHLAAALSAPAAASDPGPEGPLFDRVMTQILSGLLPPERDRARRR